VGPASPFPGEQWSKLGTLLFQHVRPITATITQAARGPERGGKPQEEERSEGKIKGKFQRGDRGEGSDGTAWKA
jgi:hypothetical protein